MVIAAERGLNRRVVVNAMDDVVFESVAEAEPAADDDLPPWHPAGSDDRDEALAVELAKPGPARTPNLTISLDKQGLAAYTVIWNLASPFMHRYTYKYGPAATTDCLRPVGYLPIPPTPVPLDEDEEDDVIDLVHPLNDYPVMPLEKYARLITVRDTPYKICTYAYDQADPPSTLRVDLLKPH